MKNGHANRHDATTATYEGRYRLMLDGRPVNLPYDHQPLSEAAFIADTQDSPVLIVDTINDRPVRAIRPRSWGRGNGRKG